MSRSCNGPNGEFSTLVKDVPDASKRSHAGVPFLGRYSAIAAQNPP